MFFLFVIIGLILGWLIYRNIIGCWQGEALGAMAENLIAIILLMILFGVFFTTYLEVKNGNLWCVGDGISAGEYLVPDSKIYP